VFLLSCYFLLFFPEAQIIGDEEMNMLKQELFNDIDFMQVTTAVAETQQQQKQEND
jgi:hypothetical protein